MNIGISSLGYVMDFGFLGNREFDKRFDLLFEANEKGLKFADDNNIDIVELLIEPADIFTDDNRSKFIDLCNSYKSIEKQVHAPFIDLSMCSNNDLIRHASVDVYVESAKICQEINAQIMTIHPGFSFYLSETIRKFIMQNLHNSVSAVLDSTKNMNVKVCIENMPKMVGLLLYVDEINEFFIKINREDLYMTWDTSHSWTCDIDLDDFWLKFHKKIKNIHLVENDNKETDKHPALGVGEVDFRKVINIARQYSYSENLIIELSSAKDLPVSIEFMNKIL